MPFRPPKPNGPTGPRVGLVPLVMPKPTSDYVKQCVRDYATKLGKPVPTDEQMDEVHPITKWRAVCDTAFNSALVADATLDWLAECGLAVMAFAKQEQPLIITPR